MPRPLPPRHPRALLDRVEQPTVGPSAGFLPLASVTTQPGRYRVCWYHLPSRARRRRRAAPRRCGVLQVAATPRRAPDSRRLGPGRERGAPACTTGTAELTLPAGFCATVFADSIAHARHVAVASNGDVYVTIEGTQPPPEKADPAREASPRAGAGFVRRAARHEPRRPRRHRQARRLDRQHRRRACERLPLRRRGKADRSLRAQRHGARPRGKARGRDRRHSAARRGHRARNFAIASDGALYLNVGSATNSCQKKDRANESMGNDPCTELETRAGIWKYDANTPEPEVLAEGALRDRHP